MQAIKFNSVCNKCDDKVYADAQAIVGKLNEKLEGFDPHSPARIAVQGQITGRYIKVTLHGETEEAMNAAENVFLSAGYFVIVDKDGDDATMYVVFDSDVAPGTEDDSAAGDAAESGEPVAAEESGAIPTMDAEPAKDADAAGDSSEGAEESETPGMFSGFMR